ncbi:MAG TPA: substrate-binding domain-containing protein [Bryobacteraceae bacterium]|jgi:quinoprotein dehydrogenase-associated probable ABC transporter substrate-binding protein|nr:substrate-binding domain-containing protein [Bryobacteraceae bacterium]
MFFRCLSLTLLATLVLGAENALRVCADPNNLPFSNQRQEGLENKLAELVAEQMGAKLEYTWWSERGSLVKNTLNAGRCDVLMGVPTSLDEVTATEPYYRSTYVFVSRRDRALRITSLADPRLSDLKIGIHVVGEDLAPPAYALARRGVTRNVVGFSLFGAYGEENPPRKLVDAVEHGDVDVAIVWGPFAGFFAQGANSPLEITPVAPPLYFGVPFAYDISMGVRKGNDALRDELNGVLRHASAAVGALLIEYNVPEVH